MFFFFQFRGDTVSHVCKSENQRIKLDLRIICHAPNDEAREEENDVINDLSSGELAKQPTASKLYHDKAKLISHGKLILNELIMKLGCHLEAVQDIRVSLIQAMGKVYVA
jgi:hypothetical protein